MGSNIMMSFALTAEQKALIKQMAKDDGKTASKLILEACKLLAEQRGFDWPDDDRQWGGDRKSGA